MKDGTFLTAKKMEGIRLTRKERSHECFDCILEFGRDFYRILGFQMKWNQTLSGSGNLLGSAEQEI